MKKSLFIFLSGAMFLAACGESANTPAEETATEEVVEVAEAQTTSADMAYTITVLDTEPASPRKEMKANLGGADITVDYGSPRVKGRTIWGDLVTMDEVWRTGANASTTFTTSADILVAGQALPAGSYKLFTKPSADTWMVMFNSVDDSWGASKYDAANDVLVVEATPAMVEEVAEEMDFMVDGDNLVVAWEKLRLPVAITAPAAE